MTLNVEHLACCPAGFADIADAYLVVEETRFAAHTQQLAMHSRVIQELVYSTGPFTWQNPLILDQALLDATNASVALLLKAMYLPGAPEISSAEEAWRLYKLADGLDCPGILQHCREFINSSSGAALLNTSATTVEWLLASHELGLGGLKKQCLEKIAHDYLTVSDTSQLQHLSSQLLLLIMQEMAQQKQRYEEEVMGRVRSIMLERSGRAICYSDTMFRDGEENHEYCFFCDKIECPGHRLRWAKVNHLNSWSGNVYLVGTYHCSKEALNLQVPAGRGAHSLRSWKLLDDLLPDSVRQIFGNGHEAGQKNFKGWGQM